MLDLKISWLGAHSSKNLSLDLLPPMGDRLQDVPMFCNVCPSSSDTSKGRLDESPKKGTKAGFNGLEYLK
jgi:hypothetical protein